MNDVGCITAFCASGVVWAVATIAGSMHPFAFAIGAFMLFYLVVGVIVMSGLVKGE